MQCILIGCSLLDMAIIFFTYLDCSGTQSATAIKDSFGCANVLNGVKMKARECDGNYSAFSD